MYDLKQKLINSYSKAINRVVIEDQVIYYAIEFMQHDHYYFIACICELLEV